MKLTILAVGRMRVGPEADLVRDWLGRCEATGRALGFGPCVMVEIDERKAQGRDRQAAALLAACGEGPLVALDERGAQMSSPAFAERIARWRDNGARALSFAIGGADGHGAALLDRADLTLSLGNMVWPHMLARAMLAEQLYRATSILAGGPYHRA